MSDDVNQCRLPHGDDGRRTLEEMNEGHRPQIQWGLYSLPPISPARILDVGCGGGVFGRMALERYPRSQCDGIDISELSIEFALESNRDLVSEGRMRLRTGDAMDLPYEDGTFDLAVSNASLFFWPSLGKGLSEVARVLRRGGAVCFTAGVHFTGVPDEGFRERYDMVNLLSDSDLLSAMNDAGLDVSCVPKPDSPICAYIGKKRRRRTAGRPRARSAHFRAGLGLNHKQQMTGPRVLSRAVGASSSRRSEGLSIPSPFRPPSS